MTQNSTPVIALHYRKSETHVEKTAYFDSLEEAARANARGRATGAWQTRVVVGEYCVATDDCPFLSRDLLDAVDRLIERDASAALRAVEFAVEATSAALTELGIEDTWTNRTRALLAWKTNHHQNWAKVLGYFAHWDNPAEFGAHEIAHACRLNPIF